jgi:hypothetical protein
VQVDPIKPTLKAPGSERSKLKRDVLLSTSAFKFSLRRYNEEKDGVINSVRDEIAKKGLPDSKVGRCILTLSNPLLTRLELSP